MNRLINALLLFISFPILAVVIFVGFDLPLEMLKVTGSQLPFRFEIFMGLGLLVFLVLVRRSIRRWTGMWMVLKKDKFKWNTPMSSSRIIRVNLYLGLEAMVMLSLSLAIYILTEEAWIPALAYFYGTLDNIIFAIVGTWKKGFRVAVSSKALLLADREVTVAYFSGLRKVSFLQQSVYFDYIKDLQISFPLECINETQKDDFFSALESQFDRDKVFVSGKIN